jgi:hypothetical protein
MDLVPAAVGDAAQLLEVEVDRLAGVLALIADHHPADSVGAGKPVHAMAAQHPIDGRAGHPQPVAKPVRALAVAAPGGQDPTDLAGWQGVEATVGREVRSARPAR